MSDGRSRPPIEIGDVLVIVESDIEVIVTKTGCWMSGEPAVEAHDAHGKKWLLRGWQVRHKPS